MRSHVTDRDCLCHLTGISSRNDSARIDAKIDRRQNHSWKPNLTRLRLTARLGATSNPLNLHGAARNLTCFLLLGRKSALYCPMNLTPDPHGQAALMLCEGALLLLIEKGIINKDQAADLIEGIIEVKREIAGVSESVVVSMESITLLRTVARSISAAAGPIRTAAS